jgi:hypothetical protein
MTEYRLDSYRQSSGTALYWAVVLGLINETEFLLNSSSDCNRQESSLEDVVFEAAKNIYYRQKLVTLILDHRGADVPVTEGLVAKIVRESDKDVVALLLDWWGVDVLVTEEVVKAVAANREFRDEIMKLLLNQQGVDVLVTEEVVATIVREFDKDVVALFLDQWGADVPFTEEVVKAAAANYRHGKGVMTLLFDQWGADVPVTEEVVKAAAANYGNGKEVMTLLFNHLGADVLVTEEVVKAAAWNSCKEVMTLLLDQREEEVIKAVVRIGAEWTGANQITFEILRPRLFRAKANSGWRYYRVSVDMLNS